MHQISYEPLSLEALIRKNVSCGTVYPLSVMQQYQRGQVFSDDGTSFCILHDCGFAFPAGKISDSFLDALYPMLLHPEQFPSGRMLLFSNNSRIDTFFRAKNGLRLSKRLFFSINDDADAVIPPVPEPYSIHEINPQILSAIRGRITPFFSWSSAEMFQQNGKGFCAIWGEKPAAWAFSAAVSDEEIDIGVETDIQHRRKGLSFLCAKAMIAYAQSVGKRPVWACSAENQASAELARKLGMKQCGECTVILKK